MKEPLPELKLADLQRTQAALKEYIKDVKSTLMYADHGAYSKDKDSIKRWELELSSINLAISLKKSME